MLNIAQFKPILRVGKPNPVSVWGEERDCNRYDFMVQLDQIIKDKYNRAGLILFDIKSAPEIIRAFELCAALIGPQINDDLLLTFPAGHDTVGAR